LKSFLLLIILSANIVWADSKPQLMSTIPPKITEMMEQFPYAYQLTIDCFDYPKIKVHACMELAEVDHAGSAYAKHNLGIAYEEGTDGLKQSYADAFYWYLRAANQGLDASQYNLGRMYEFGLGIQSSHVMAKALYLKSSKQGNTKATDRLGVLYLLAMNQEEEKGLMPYELKIEFMSTLQAWQIEEAYSYFE